MLKRPPDDAFDCTVHVKIRSNMAADCDTKEAQTPLHKRY